MAVRQVVAGMVWRDVPEVEEAVEAEVVVPAPLAAPAGNPAVVAAGAGAVFCDAVSVAAPVRQCVNCSVDHVGEFAKARLKETVEPVLAVVLTPAAVRAVNAGIDCATNTVADFAKNQIGSCTDGTVSCTAKVVNASVSLCS